MNASSKSTWISKVKVDFAATRCGCRHRTSPAPPACPTGLAAFPGPGVRSPACDRVVHVNAAFDFELSRWLGICIGVFTLMLNFRWQWCMCLRLSLRLRLRSKLCCRVSCGLKWTPRAFSRLRLRHRWGKTPSLLYIECARGCTALPLSMRVLPVSGVVSAYPNPLVDCRCLPTCAGRSRWHLLSVIRPSGDLRLDKQDVDQGCGMSG